jgi:hypothetical protein
MIDLMYQGATGRLIIYIIKNDAVIKDKITLFIKGRVNVIQQDV